jgi:signal transduction histidine kinase
MGGPPFGDLPFGGRAHFGEGPPFAAYRAMRHDARPWRRHGRFLFVRFAAIFGIIALLFISSMGALAFLLSRIFGGGRPTTLLVWIVGCAVIVILPLTAASVARRAFRRIAMPLADLMAAADAVGRGDLSVRVPIYGPGEFGQLAVAFNRMMAELERADQQRRNLTADVAHELRTPLHVIQGNLEGVLDGVYQPTPEHINATLSETRALARLVEDLRTLSLAEAGQLPLHPEAVDVAELLADAGTSFSGQAESAGIRLLVEPPAAPLTLQGDAGRLDQVLSNLLANALRHTPAGGTIRLAAAPVKLARDGAAGVRITVADTGEGIAPADLPFIFDRFWRGDPARGHAHGAGSGLGLAIARQLVQAHGGQIEAQSQPGAGTTFTIDLPQASN